MNVITPANKTDKPEMIARFFIAEMEIKSSNYYLFLPAPPRVEEKSCGE